MSADTKVLAKVFDDFMNTEYAFNNNKSRFAPDRIEIKPFTPLPPIVPVHPNATRVNNVVELKSSIVLPLEVSYEKIYTFKNSCIQFRAAQIELINKCKQLSDIRQNEATEAKVQIQPRITFTAEQRMSIWLHRAGLSNTATCITCDRVLYKSLSWEIGHDEALSVGGTNDYENLYIQCGLCNEAASALNFLDFKLETTGKIFVMRDEQKFKDNVTLPNNSTMSVERYVREHPNEAGYYAGLNRDELFTLYWFAEHTGCRIYRIAIAYAKTLLQINSTVDVYTVNNWIDDLIIFAKSVSVCNMVCQHYTTNIERI